MTRASLWRVTPPPAAPPLARAHDVVTLHTGDDIGSATRRAIALLGGMPAMLAGRRVAILKPNFAVAIVFPDRKVGTSKMSTAIVAEAFTYVIRQLGDERAHIREQQGLGARASPPSFLTTSHQPDMHERAGRGGQLENKVRSNARRVMRGQSMEQP
jgi:hypothetical protein